MPYLLLPVQKARITFNDYINESFLNTHIDHFNRQFYICGPDGMIKSISDILFQKGVDPEAVVFEK